MQSKILGVKNEVLKDCDEWDTGVNPPRCGKPVDMTLGRILSMAFNTADRTVSGAEQARRGKLAIEFLTAQQEPLTLADRKTLDDLVAKGVGTKDGWPAVVVYRVHEFLAPGETK